MKTMKISAEVEQQLTEQCKNTLLLIEQEGKMKRDERLLDDFLEANFPAKHRKNLKVFIMVTASVKIIKAKLAMPAGEWEFLAQSRLMQKAIFTNTLSYFTPVFALLAAWETANTLLNTALTAVANKTAGATGLKVTAMAGLNGILKKALAYVNGLCIDSQSTAVAIIGAAFMQQTATGTRIVKDVTVSIGTAGASINCKCPAAKIDGKRVVASYEKGYSTDKGVTWTDLVAIPKCKTIAYHLEVGVPHIFRSRYTTSKEGTTVYVYSKPITPE